MEAKSYLKADFLDIVFEGKNKAYGAYTLRRKYGQRLTRAIIATAGLLLILVGIITVLKYVKANAPAAIKEESSDVVLQQVDVEPDLLPPPHLLQHFLNYKHSLHIHRPRLLKITWYVRRRNHRICVS